MCIVRLYPQPVVEIGSTREFVCVAQAFKYKVFCLIRHCVLYALSHLSFSTACEIVTLPRFIDGKDLGGSLTCIRSPTRQNLDLNSFLGSRTGS